MSHYFKLKYGVCRERGTGKGVRYRVSNYKQLFTSLLWFQARSSNGTVLPFVVLFIWKLNLKRWWFFASSVMSRFPNLIGINYTRKTCIPYRPTLIFTFWNCPVLPVHFTLCKTKFNGYIINFPFSVPLPVNCWTPCIKWVISFAEATSVYNLFVSYPVL